MLKKRYLLMIILLTVLIIFSGCDNTEESVIKEQKYLSLALNNDYSVKSLTPGQGRYSYDKNSIAEIEFELNEGYKFDSWEGDAKSRLASADEKNSYQLKMTEDSQLRLKTIFNNFKLLTAALSDIREYNYSEGIKIDALPYNLKELRLKFNNKVNENNELEFEINDPDSADSENETIISSENYGQEIFSIKENKIILNWEHFNPVEKEDLSFGSDYQLLVKEETENHIFDSQLNEISSEVKIDFQIEEASPEKVENLVLDTEASKLELSWLRSEANKDYQNEDYVSEYIIYEFKNESEFIKENADNKFKMNLDEDADNEELEFDVNQNDKIIRVIIYDEEEFKNLDLDNNNYSYRVSAVNSVDNEGELSEAVSTN